MNQYTTEIERSSAKDKERSERYQHLVTAILVLTGFTGGVIFSTSLTLVESLGAGGANAVGILVGVLGGLSGYFASLKTK